MNEPPGDPNKIEGNPSKELFISMLIKDITLKDAIGDLIDNSVDAANKNAVNKEDLSAFAVNITFDKNHFQIIDNAGGIEEEVARESAFKLGKPKAFKLGKHTIGQFGIGMKRAFFKLGEQIEVDSVAFSSSFKIKISVPAWRDELPEKDWDFNFDSVTKNQENLLEATFTKIIVTDLKDEAKKQFSDPQFITDLRNEIALEHQFAINRGLKILINGQTLEAPAITLIYTKDFKPSYWSHEFENGLKVEILTGMSEDKGEDGGWYIFCNDRLILGPDTTEITGWKGGRGKAGKEGKEMPKYHDQFFRFRGYVFFNSDNASNLPWNTSKTGMDKDSPDFTYVRTQMIMMAKQVKSAMDDMKTERENNNPIDRRFLNKKVETAEVLTVSKVMANKASLPSVYKYPKDLMTKASKEKDITTVTFLKKKKEVQDAMSYFKVNDEGSAGSLAFDYFHQNEIGKK